MTTRLTRLSAQAAAQQPAATRLTRLSAQAAAQQPAATRLTRIAVQVAVGSIDNPVLRGPRRAGVILQRHPDAIART